MRIVFMGTPDFAVPSLNALLERGHEILAVYTQPDKPKGRGHKLLPPPVKETAMAHNIEVRQPTTFKNNEDEIAYLKALAPELIVVAAYGKIDLAAACAEHPAARVHQRARLFAAEVPRRRADPVGGAERR